MDTYDKSIISRNIAKLLEGNKISQTALAKHLGITQIAVSYYVSGSRTPKIEHLVKIANYFNISLDELCQHEMKETELQKRSNEIANILRQNNMALGREFSPALADFLESSAFMRLASTFVEIDEIDERILILDHQYKNALEDADKNEDLINDIVKDGMIQQSRYIWEENLVRKRIADYIYNKYRDISNQTELMKTVNRKHFMV